MHEGVRTLVDAEWEARLGVERAVLRGGGVHVVAADLGANDAMAFLLGRTCIVVVSPEAVEPSRAALIGLDVPAVFTAAALRTLVGRDAQVHGPSQHSYTSRSSFRGTADEAAQPVKGDDPRLLSLLQNNDPSDRDESGFPRDPSAADPATTRFWILREHDHVLAAGNMTEWRSGPADVGVLTDRSHRSRGTARRLVGAMVADALRSVDVVRYRALASNTASLAVADRLGFEPYGRNYRARRRIQ